MSIIDRLLELAVQIQQVPAPTFEEGQRAGFVRELFIREDLLDVHLDEVGNVLGRLPGSGSGTALVVSAHLDTVFPVETSLQVTRHPDRIAAPGIGDNSVGIAGLVGLLWSLQERDLKLKNDVWLVANVGEEGLGDLRGMRAVVDRFGESPLAYIVLEGMALGHIYNRGLGVRRYLIQVNTPGGHSWTDYGQPSSIHELSKLVASITALELPSEPRSSMNVGRISGGTSVNTIAAEAWMELDLRSENEDTLVGIVSQVEKLASEIARLDVTVEMGRIGNRPAGEIAASHPLVETAIDCLRGVGYDPSLMVGSTDANIPLSLGLPAVCIGLTTGGGAHTVHEFINTEPVTQGLEQLVQLVCRLGEIE